MRRKEKQIGRPSQGLDCRLFVLVTEEMRARLDEQTAKTGIPKGAIARQGIEKELRRLERNG